MPTITLVADDISCDRCRRNIETDLSGVPGVTRVNVEVPSKQVYVEYDPAILDADRIRATMIEIGYPAV
jgi:copper chaperone CopZ